MDGAIVDRNPHIELGSVRRGAVLYSVARAATGDLTPYVPPPLDIEMRLPPAPYYEPDTEREV